MTVAGDIRTVGGMLFHHPDGRSGCSSCGWSGVPNFGGGRRVGPPRRHFGPDGPAGFRVEGAVRSDECPSCEQLVELALVPARREPKVGRNEPCPCGSERKYKRCCGVAA